MPTLDEYVKNSTDSMNQMYDQQRISRLAELNNSYQQSLSAAQQAREQIPGQYQQQANDLAVQYERNKRNLNEQAAANGLNTGTASQAQLMANQGWMKNYGALRTAQANALTAADRGIADLTATHEAKTQAAMADIEASRAEANLKIQQAAQQEQYARDMEQAKLRAGFGDFSGFLSLGYDQKTIDNMRQVWIAQNPLLAYNTGAIDASTYTKMTGKKAPGAPAAASAASSYYSSGTPSTTTDKSGTPASSASALDTLKNLWNTAKSSVSQIPSYVTNTASTGTPAPTSTTGDGSPTYGHSRRGSSSSSTSGSTGLLGLSPAVAIARNLR